MKQSKRRSDRPELPPRGTADRQFAVRFIGVILVLSTMTGAFALIGYSTQHRTRALHAEQQYSAIARRLAPAGQVATAS